MDPRRRLAILAALTLLAPSLFGHETWLAPSQGSVAPGVSLRIDMTSGGEFPILETAIDAARLDVYGVRLGGETTRPALAAGPRSLRLSFMPPKGKQGFATVFASLKPRRLVLTPDKVAEYLDEIGQTAAFLDKWKSRPEPRTWREEYSKHAKAYFRVGKTTGDDSWKTPTGLALEIIPLVDPSRANPAEPFAIQVLKAGRPFPGLTLAAIVDAKTPRAFATTDAEGKASFKMDRPGRWLIEGTYLRESTKTGLDFESDFSTLLVMVTPSARHPEAEPAKR